MGNLFSIGDIHGQRPMLDLMIDRVPFQKDDEIVFIGDFIDRGPDSRGVVDAVLEFRLKFSNTTCLRGNHEDIFLDYIKGEDRYDPGLFTMNGGYATLESYGIDPREGPPKLPPLHMEFFEELKFIHETGGFIFVHAGFRPGVPIEEQTERDMLWIRNDFFESNGDFGRPVVFGHTPMREISNKLPKWLGIDTGAAFGNMLTCVQLAEEKITNIYQVHADEVNA